MKLAIVHEYLNQYGGGERVMEALHELYPEAPVFTLIFDPEKVPRHYQSWDIRPSPLVAKLPFLKKHYKKYFPLYPVAVEQFDLSEYDCVISSSHLWAKGAITRSDTCHVCYCYTPMRQAWDKYHEYLERENENRALKKFLPFVMNYIRMWDRLTADRVDHFIGISEHVCRRIRKHYRRDAEVIYPPVDTEFYSEVTVSKQDYFLCVSRLVPYKRIDLAVEAFNHLGLPLKIVGDGNDYKKLKSIARDNIEFLGWLPDEEIRQYYGSARAFVFPGEEDFGITPVEAQAAGTPVIAFARGGVLETVLADQTGLFFPHPSAESLGETVRKFEEQEKNFDPALIRSHAGEFDKRVFSLKFHNFFLEKYRAFHETGLEKKDTPEQVKVLDDTATG